MTRVLEKTQNGHSSWWSVGCRSESSAESIPTTMSSIPQRVPPPRRPRKKGHDQSFASYLSFGFYSTACVGCFLVTYVMVLAFISPLLKLGENADPLESLHIPHAPENILEVASSLRAQLHYLRQGSGVTDESLLNAAKAEYEVLRARKREMLRASHRKPVLVEKGISPQHERKGFVVLGMHRSGTSMLSGLLVKGCGYNVGGPLIGSAFDNEKGFFERIDVVLQNDIFMGSQGIGWSAGVRDYNADLALKHKKEGKIKFKEGERALQFLNDPSKAPWLQKDPRMCITLPTWLKLLSNEPAVVFTYRHPLEVAMSLNKREKNFGLEHGLRLWIMYNMKAIQNSEKLCRVLSSNDAILQDPVKEVQRISDELSSKCGVPSPPHRITQEDVHEFVDPELQHNKKKREEADKEKKVIEEHGGCKVFEYESDEKDGSPEKELEMTLYKKAMKMYCDFQSGEAYKPGYEWPAL